MLNRLLKYIRARKLISVILTIVILIVGVMYGTARWYIHTESSKPLELGVSFIPDYAASLGVDPRQNMDGLLGIGVKHFRLTIGLRQPRWPECHMPDWAAKEPAGQWQPQLKSYMQKVIQRYQNSPALQNYQLENEYFLTGFGTCEQIPDSLTRDRLISEYNLVKKLDPKHPVIIGRSNNALGFPTGQPQPDEFSISVYKRVWDATVTQRYIEYPFPAWFYAWLAGTQKIFLHKDMMIAELQAEAWAPNSKSIQQISLNEQNKSLNAKRLEGRFNYGRATGMRQMYLWGAEYWYYRQQILHDPSLWNVARREFSQ
jgi:hypothetical protein